MNSALDVLAQGVLQNNLILLQGLGMFALTRYTKSMATALKASVAVACAMFTSSIIVWAIESLLPTWYSGDIAVYLFVAFLSAMFWQKVFGGTRWLDGYGSSLSSSLLDSALVGLLLFASNNGFTGLTMVGFSLSAALGFGLVLVVMAAIRERLELAPIPRALRGVPILLISAGLLAVALLGFRL